MEKTGVTCISRYIATALLRGWSLALIILTAVFSLFVLIGELDSINTQYQIHDALRYVFLTMPQRILDLSPVIFLLGTMAALAELARHNELTAMRAAGVTMAHLVRSVAVPATLLVIILLLVTEYISAPLYQHAETQRTVIRTGTANILDRKGLWSNDRLRFFSVHTLRAGRIPSGIDLYEFQPDGQLKTAIHASHADVNSSSREWTLVDVQYKTLIDGSMSNRHLDKLDMGPFWLREELPVLSISSAGMSITGLYEYVQHLTDTGQRAGFFELAFWRKLSMPVAAGIMIIAAVPVGAAPDPRCRTAFGRRIALGAIIGILFYLGTQITHAAGLLLGINAALIAVTPPLIVLAASVFLFSRFRW